METQSSICEPQYHQFIIIGAGISGLTAGRILAQQNKDFLIIQASDTIGGRIRTQKIKDVIKIEKIQKNWIVEDILETPVQVGATWVAKEHSFVLRLIQQYQLTLFPQYSDGLAVYGVHQSKYQKVETLADFYKKYQKQLLKLVNKIQNLSLNMCQISNSNIGPSQSLLLQEYIKFYDNMTVSKFIHSEIQDIQLADMIMNQMQTLQCISCDNFSVLQLIDDDGCMQLLKLYCQKVDDTIDGMKVKQGMVQMIRRMETHIREIREENQQAQIYQQIVRLNQPVQSIHNQLGEDVRIIIKNGKTYTCNKVFFSVPIAVANQIQIKKISPSKKLIFQNQQYGSVIRYYFVFPEAFWRPKYNGYVSFSRKFPFNELTELSPSNLACGIVAFVFVHNKFQTWQQSLRKQHPQHTNIEQLQIKFMLKTISDIFLDSNFNSQHLSQYFSYKRTFQSLQYIRAAYQTTTKPQVWKKIKDSGDDYGDSYCRDQYNIVYIGSQIAEAEDHGSYMEGAVRIARKKVHQHLGIKDPWESYKDKVIQW